MTIGVLIILLSGTTIRYLWVDEENYKYDPEALTVWKDFILVILGALSGYIAGKGNDKPN